MTTHTPLDSIQKAVLEKVRSGVVRRRPRLYFVLKVTTTIFVSLLLVLAAMLLISYILFTIHESGEGFLLGYGLSGILAFFSLFSWTLLLLVIGLVLLLEWLLQSFKFGYRIPLLTVFIGLIVIVAAGGIVTNFTPLHPALQRSADADQLPLVGGFYSHILDRHEDHGVFRGIVVSTTTDSFEVTHNDNDKDHDDGTYTVMPEQGTAIPSLMIGDRVLIFGTSSGNTISAKNIQILSPLER